MLNVEDLLSGNFTSYPEEVRPYLENFSQELREELKCELVDVITKEMIEDAKNNTEDFILKISNILNSGHMGYNNMSTKALLDSYLTIKKQEDFIQLIEKVSNKLEKEY